MSKPLIFAIVGLLGLVGILFTFLVINSKTNSCSPFINAVDELHRIVAKQETQIKKNINTAAASGDECSPKVCNTKEKRVVSFGLYGNDPRYTVGALHNAELVKYILPGWVCRFYVDGTVPEDVIKQLKDEGAEIVSISNIKGGIAGMFWRFLVADDETVDRYIVRDADSRLSMRERMTIEEWMASGKPFHVIRDHPNHNYAMNGGLWGGSKGALGTKMSTLIDQWNSKDSYLADMDFLGHKIWPLIQDKVIGHDAFHCTRWPNSHPFPTRRVNREIVGGVYDKDDVPREGDAKALRESPGECRKKPNWTMG